MNRECGTTTTPSDVLESDNSESVSFLGAEQGENDAHRSLELRNLGV